MKKGYLCAAVIVMLCLLAPFSAHSAQSLSLSALQSCKNIRSCSNSSGAFFYGWSSDTLVFARALPDDFCYTAKPDGVVCCACVDKDRLCALLRGSHYSYSLMTLDGNGNTYTAPLDINININRHSIAVCGNEVFLIRDSAEAEVQSFRTDGGNGSVYRLSDDPMELFVNGGKVYAQTCRGDIYNLSGGRAEYCCSVGAYAKLSDAGEGWVLSDGTRLVSLDGDAQRRLFSDYGCAVCRDGVLYYGKSGELHIGGITQQKSCLRLASYGGRLACLDESYSCTIMSESDYSEVGSEPALDFDGRLEAGTTAAQLRGRFPGIEIFTGDGASVSSGLIKTGFSVRGGNKTVKITVMGDVTGNGKCGATDIKRLMKHLCGAETLDGVFRDAADLNGDNKLSNADLVLIYRKSKE